MKERQSVRPHCFPLAHLHLQQQVWTKSNSVPWVPGDRDDRVPFQCICQVQQSFLGVLHGHDAARGRLGYAPNPLEAPRVPNTEPPESRFQPAVFAVRPYPRKQPVGQDEAASSALHEGAGLSNRIRRVFAKLHDPLKGEHVHKPRVGRCFPWGLAGLAACKQGQPQGKQGCARPGLGPRADRRADYYDGPSTTTSTPGRQQICSRESQTFPTHDWLPDDPGM